MSVGGCERAQEDTNQRAQVRKYERRRAGMQYAGGQVRGQAGTQAGRYVGGQVQVGRYERARTGMRAGRYEGGQVQTSWGGERGR